MPSGSIYTFTGVANPSNNTTQIETSQGFVALGTYGYFLPAEVQAATADGLILQAGIVGAAVAAAAHAGPAITGSDGTVGGPGGSPLTGSVATVSSGSAPLVSVGGTELVNIPTFQASTLYPAGFVIVQAGTLYSRIAPGTSGLTFGADSANWTVVGVVNEAGLTLSDVTTDNVSAAAHGFAPKLSASPADVLMGDGLWSPPNAGSRGLFLSTDFLNAGSNTVAPGWFAQAIASGNITGALGNPAQPGVVGLQCAVTTANSGYQLRAGPFYLQGGELAEFIFNQAITANGLLFMGFHNSTSAAAPTKGCWIDIGNTTLSGKTGGTAVQTTGTTFTITAGVWYHAKIAFNAAGTACFFYLYNLAGTLLWSDSCAITANLPLTTDSLQHSIVTYNTLSQAQATITFMDYMSVTVPRLLAR